MSSRTVAAIFDADVSRYVAKVTQMRRVTRETASQISQSAVKNKADWDRMGSAALGAGALIAGGLAAVTSAAMGWESAFAGVRKTVDEADPAFAGLEGSLREMARTMATSHEEIAAVAESAGALGVKTKDIAQFTRTMVMLGETTNLTADEASTSLAQLMNIMGTAPEKVSNLAAELVDLGNNGASTERQIVELSQRLAGAARAVGLNESQLLAYSSAIASVGMNVEAGGTAMSKVFTKLDRIVQSGSDKIETLNEVTGTDFAKAFQQDASGAVQMLIEKLGQLQAGGGSITKVMDDIGIKGVYETDVIRRLAGAHGLLADQLGIGAKSYQAGTAALDEYAKRAATSESKVKVAWNNVKDAAIDAGAVILPMVAEGADQIAKWASQLRELPEPAKSAAVQVAALAAAGLLVVGGGMKLVGTIASISQSLDVLREKAPRAASAVGKLGKAAGVAAAIAGLLEIAGQLSNNLIPPRTVAGIEAATSALIGLTKAGDRAAVNRFFTLRQPDGTLREIAKDVDSLGGAFRRLFQKNWEESFSDWGEGFFRWTGAKGATDDMVAAINDLDSALTGMAQNGNASKAAEAFRMIRQEIGGNASDEQVLSQFDDYRAALLDTANAFGVTVSDVDLYRWALGEVPQAIKNAAAQGGSLVDGLTDQQKGFSGVADKARGAADALEDYHAKALALAGNELGVNMTFGTYRQDMKRDGGFSFKTKAGQQNNQKVLDIAGQANAYLNSLEAAGADTEKLEGATEKWRRKLAEAYEYGGKTKEDAAALAATYIGLSSAQPPTFAAPGLPETSKQAKELAKIVADLPESAETVILAPGARPAKKDVDAFMATVKDVPEETRTQIRTIAELGGVEAARAAIAKLHDKQVKIYIDTVNRTYYRKYGADNDKNKADGGLMLNMAGALVDAFADGGVRGYMPTIGSQQPRIETNRGPGGIMWAETGAGPWEAFVSGHPAKRDRSRDITTDVVDRLGGTVEWRNADGGIRDYQQYSRYRPAPATVQPAPATFAPSMTQHNYGVDAAELAARNAAQWDHRMQAWAVQR